MITGVVRGREACVRLSIRGPRARRREIEAVIDTGYTAWLTLPPALIAALRLPWHSVGRGVLADGSECLFDVYEATAIWDRREVRVLVDEAHADPLVGMAMLKGYELRVEVRTRGKVTIKKLSGSKREIS
jgi:clan AA aspartic protease